MLKIKLLFVPLKRFIRNMSVFTQKLNPLAGKLEWEIQDEKYDYHQEIARAAFADMLHDTERNRLYYKALKKAIDKMHSQKKEAHVLDIGTGTGLLSMMAVKCGADSVTACETFLPVAECAKHIIKENGCAEKIKLIPKNSIDLKVGRIGDMKQKANILVTEVFDTELIGEGAISIFDHAHKELLEEDCIVVPQSATIFAQIVESPLALDWYKFKPITEENNILPVVKIPEKIENCVGSPAIHDIQLSQFPLEHFKTITAPTSVITFDWSGKSKLVKKRNNVTVQNAEQDGTAQIVFFWWELIMDIEEKLILSCAPYWAHPHLENFTKSNNFSIKDALPWRDHWMQGVYFLPKELKVEKGEKVTLISSHDEYSLWFAVKEDSNILPEDYDKQLCQCGLHFALSRTRLGQINDCARNKKYMRALRSKITPNTVCLCLSDGSLLSIIAAQFGAKKVINVTNMHMINSALEEFSVHNDVKEKMSFYEDIDELIEKEKDLKDVNLVIGEPFFITSLLPWHNFRFMVTLKKELKNFVPNVIETIPQKATVNAIACNFYNLQKINCTLNTCEGFSMKYFDDLIKDSSNKADAKVEPQPLWEYTSKALCPPFKLVEFDIPSFNPSISKEVMGEIRFVENGLLNGIALWVDWHLDNSSENIISTGPTSQPEINEEIKWDMHTRQGVYLLRDPIIIKSNDILHYTAFFSTDDVVFEFRLNGKMI